LLALSLSFQWGIFKFLRAGLAHKHQAPFWGIDSHPFSWPCLSKRLLLLLLESCKNPICRNGNNIPAKKLVQVDASSVLKIHRTTSQWNTIGVGFLENSKADEVLHRKFSVSLSITNPSNYTETSLLLKMLQISWSHKFTPKFETGFNVRLLMFMEKCRNKIYSHRISFYYTFLLWYNKSNAIK